MHKKMAAALLTCSFLVSSCAHDVVAVPLRPDLEHPERMVCAAQGARPTIPAEYRIDWAHVTTVAQAHAEHDAFVRVIRSREGIITGYLTTIEGRLFVCSNNAAWWRDYWAGLPDPPAP